MPLSHRECIQSVHYPLTILHYTLYYTLYYTKLHYTTLYTILCTVLHYTTLYTIVKYLKIVSDAKIFFFFKLGFGR